jgi:putative cardiolipin synthase
LFNPWNKRGSISRVGEGLAKMERLNIRMHDKLIIADGLATILGGRNIGDHYFGLSDAFNFHDLDILAVGAIAQEANDMFDHFWNSDWITSVENLTTEADAEAAEAGWQRVIDRSRNSKALASFALEPKDWSAEFELLLQEIHPGSGFLVYDEVSASEVGRNMLGHMFALFDQAQSELLITNAYFLPGDPAIEFLEGLTERGVDVRLLTNSLESNDVPAVNSHYEKWRKPIINAGVSLYEFRADPEIGSSVDIPPVTGKFIGLHTKAAVIDRRLVFVGSMNLDPRSAAINTEMGAIIESTELAAALREMMLRDMRGENSWHVTLNESGKLEWANSDETVTNHPSRGFLQDVMNVVLKVVPKSQN